MKTKFIVVAGGVISGVGKGVTTASLGKILQKYGYSVTLIKIDPYINYDAGTLRPTEHGEVWVTEDGGEIDQDLGTYERFINLDISKKNNITTGQIYKTVIDRERAGQYLGQTVQFVPHILDEIKQRIISASQGKDFAIVELGGTVGDYENTPFLFALKSLEREIGSDAMAYCLVTYLPVPDHAPEMKTKPTQQAIRLLGQEGILPDFIICRAKFALDETRKKKIESSAYVSSDHVICAPDIETVYEMPLFFEQEKLGLKILNHFKLTPIQNPDWSVWTQLVNAIKNPAHTIKIAIIGKYLESGDYSLTDSYLSIEQALVHAAAHKNVGFDIEWINAQEFEQHPDSIQRLAEYDGIIIPGGFGNSGVEGKIAAISYARINKIPLLGLCYGLQLAVVEYARNVAGLQGAHTIEVNQNTPYPVITLLEYQRKIMDERSFGAPCVWVDTAL
ncbi:CTP synthetase [Candidatus Dependentiae bacterium Noda2021]|nr:CTP synthetase [Candidatus Dependentiae bacterium Noda2021]